MRIASLIAIAAISITAIAQSSVAQGLQCGNRETIVAQLSKKHKEQQAAIGLAKDGRLFEVWGSYETASFTVLLTWPNLKSCIVASGEQLEMRPLREFAARFEF